MEIDTPGGAVPLDPGNFEVLDDQPLRMPGNVQERRLQSLGRFAPACVAVTRSIELVCLAALDEGEELLSQPSGQRLKPRLAVLCPTGLQAEPAILPVEMPDPERPQLIQTQARADSGSIE